MGDGTLGQRAAAEAVPADGQFSEVAFLRPEIKRVWARLYSLLASNEPQTDSFRRGLANVKTETALSVLVYNIIRVINLIGSQSLKIRLA